MSSSCMEAASNGVLSLLISIRTHIQVEEFYLHCMECNQGAAEVVTVDVVDTAGERIIPAKIGMLHDSEKSADYHKGIVKSPDL